MKKALTILLIFGIFANTIGYFIINHCEIYRAKAEAKERIVKGFAENNLVLITVNNNENSQLTNYGEEEISWNGKLYDVVKKEVVNNKTVYTCLADKKENDLISSSNEEIQHQTGSGTSKHIFSNYKSIQLFCEEKGDFVPSFTFIKDTFFINMNESTVKAFLNIPSPPPWSC